MTRSGAVLLCLIVLGCDRGPAQPSVVYAPPPPRLTGVSGNRVPLAMLGCYALFDADGRPVDSTYYNASEVVRLDTAPEFTDSAYSAAFMIFEARPSKARREGIGMMYPLGPSQAMRIPLHDGTFAWAIDSDMDSLEMSFSDGLSGVSLNFLLPDTLTDTMIGTITDHWDTEPFRGERGLATAIRIACPRSPSYSTPPHPPAPPSRDTPRVSSVDRSSARASRRPRGRRRRSRRRSAPGARPA